MPGIQWQRDGGREKQDGDQQQRIIKHGREAAKKTRRLHGRWAGFFFDDGVRQNQILNKASFCPRYMLITTSALSMIREKMKGGL